MLSDICGRELRGGKMCGRPKGHGGNHASTEALARCRKKGSEYSARWAEKNPDAVRNKAIRKMGLSPEGYAAILLAQNGHCAICGVVEPGGRCRWHIDHDHDCCPEGRACERCIRGLLCWRCNSMLGYARDNIEILMSAVDYLSGRK